MEVVNANHGSAGPKAPPPPPPPAPIMNLPVEIICMILRDIDKLNHLYSILTTCRRFFEVFLVHRKYILNAFDGPYHFDLGLAAVRATRLVSTALETDQLVYAGDILPVDSLTSQARPPSPAELFQVFELHHFATCVGRIIMDNDLDELMQADRLNHMCEVCRNEEPDDAPCATMQPKREMGEVWIRRFHRTLYRLILCGAALSGAYLEPFIQTSLPQPAGFLGRILSSTLVYVRGAGHDLDIYVPNDEDLAYFSGFPLYCHGSRSGGGLGVVTDDAATILKPVADWLLGDMEAEAAIEFNTGVSSLLPPRSPARQIEQLIRLTQELSAGIETDGWGRGLFFSENTLSNQVSSDAVLEIAERVRESPGFVVRQPQGVVFCDHPPGKCFRQFRVLRYGVFQPERVLAMTYPRDLWKSCCSDYAELLRKEGPSGPSTLTEATVAGRLFGGTPGKALKVERVLSALHLPPQGLLTYAQERIRRDEESNADGGDDSNQEMPEGWHNFWGDFFDVDPDLLTDMAEMAREFSWLGSYILL